MDELLKVFSYSIVSAIAFGILAVPTIRLAEILSGRSDRPLTSFRFDMLVEERYWAQAFSLFWSPGAESSYHHEESRRPNLRYAKALWERWLPRLAKSAGSILGGIISIFSLAQGLLDLGLTNFFSRILEYYRTVVDTLLTPISLSFLNGVWFDVILFSIVVIAIMVRFQFGRSAKIEGESEPPRSSFVTVRPMSEGIRRLGIVLLVSITTLGFAVA